MSSEDAYAMLKDTQNYDGDKFIADSPKHKSLLIVAMKQLFENNSQHYISRIKLGGSAA